MITQDIFSQLKEIEKARIELSNKIDMRLAVIVKTICDVLKCNCEWYDYRNGSMYDEIDGHFSPVEYKTQIELYGQGSIFDDEATMFFNRNGDLCAISDGIPTRWLWENFEPELVKGRQGYLDKLKIESENRKEKAEKRKKNKKEIVKSIKQKLTPDELRLIKIN